jgi:hypothetical protein
VDEHRPLQRINSPADGVSKHGAFVKIQNFILPKSFIFAAKFSRPVEWGLEGVRFSELVLFFPNPS